MTDTLADHLADTATYRTADGRWAVAVRMASGFPLWVVEHRYGARRLWRRFRGLSTGHPTTYRSRSAAQRAAVRAAHDQMRRHRAWLAGEYDNDAGF